MHILPLSGFGKIPFPCLLKRKNKCFSSCAPVEYAAMKGFLAYLHNQVFPPLLTAEEEKECLAALAAGDETARSCLIEHNLRLVAHIAKKFEGSGVERDDLLSIGTVGLVKGISSFRPDRGARLATYAARCIENEILMHLRAIRNQRTEISLYDPVGTDKEGNELALMDVLDDGENGVSEQLELADEKRLLKESFSVLDEKECFVLNCRYGLDGTERQTQKQVAEHLGISRSYVSRIESRAMSKLRQCMEEQGAGI